MPLTTPMLSGARVRMTDRDGLELVVPKASGGRGNYVVPWRNIPDLCQPGVHDTRLVERVGTLRSVTRAAVRAAGGQTAAEGFAGRRPRAACQAAAAMAQEAQVMTNYHLLLSLVRQFGLTATLDGPIRPTQLEPLAKAAIGRLAVCLNRDGGEIATALSELAGMLAPIGLGERVGTARLPSVLVSMQALRSSIAMHPANTPWEAAAVGLVTKTTDVTLACLTRSLAGARAMVQDIPGLLKSWLADPAGIAANLCRSDWLTDGWGWLCHLWSLAADAPARLQALDELVMILPTLPKEVAGWAGYGGPDLPPRIAQRSSEYEGGRLSLLDAIMRNETLLALAA